MEPLDPTVQAIFDQAAVGIAQIGLDGAWLRVNNRYCQMLGYSEAELLARTPQDIDHADDWAEVLAGRRRLLEGVITSHSIEKRYVRKDGGIFWGRLNQSLVRDHDNLPQYFIAVVEDITERIQAERALKESERRLELALDAAGLGFWDRDLRTGVTVISGAYGRLHGLAPNHASLSHEEWLKLVHPDDRQRVDEQYRQSLERTHFWDTEFRLVWPDGSVHWILAKGRVFLDNLGCPVRLAGISIDITERKRGEEQRSRLASIVESSEDAIFSKNLDGTIASWNSGAEKLFGYTAEEIIGKPLSLLLPPERLDEFPQILQRIRSGAHLEHYEVPRMCKDGRRVEISVAISPIRDSAGAVVGSSTIARDITERTRIGKVLRQNEERFRLAIKATNDAIWDIDLKTGTVSWNETYSTLYGRPPETSDSWQWWIDRIHPEDREATVGELRAAIASGASSWTREYRFQRSDARWAHIYDRAYIARDRSGQAWRVIGAMQDLTNRKQAEAALRESEARLMNAQRLAKVGSWERNLETDKIDWSDEMLRILGISNDPPSTLAAFLNHVHPKDREQVLQAANEVRSRIAPVEVSYRIVRPDGEVRFVRAIVETIRDNRGKAVRTVGSTQDTTEQIKAGELLRESEERLKNAERLAHVGHWYWDLKTNRASWSEEVFRILGKPTDYTPSYEGFLQTVVPKDRERVARWVGDCLAEKRGNSIEFQVAWPNGEVKTVACMSEVSIGDEGSPSRILGACQDITGRRQVEEMLRGLAGNLLAAQENERRRISQELHDDLTQRLAALAMELGSLAAELPAVPKRINKRLRALQRGVVEAAETSRHVAYQLHPSELDDLGLVTALRAYCEEGRDGISVKFTSRNVPESMNREVASCLYKVTQESLRNVAKHGKTTRAWVTLEGKKDRIVLQVRDDGVGFPVESLGAGVGLGVVGMQERVRNVKGSFVIRSRANQGTVITVEVPLSAQNGGSPVALPRGVSGDKAFTWVKRGLP